MRGRLFSVHYFTVSPEGLKFLKKPTRIQKAFQTNYVEDKNHVHTVISLHIRIFSSSAISETFILSCRNLYPVGDFQPTKVKINLHEVIISALTVDISVAISDTFSPSCTNKFLSAKVK